MYSPTGLIEKFNVDRFKRKNDETSLICSKKRENLLFLLFRYCFLHLQAASAAAAAIVISSSFFIHFVIFSSASKIIIQLSLKFMNILLSSLLSVWILVPMPINIIGCTSTHTSENNLNQ